MKLKIERRFVDKYTKEVYEAGTVQEFKAERAAELLADNRGLVSGIPEETAEEVKPAEKEAKAPEEPKPEKKPARRSKKK